MARKPTSHMQIQYMNIDAIVPYAFNNKDHSKNVHHIAESIKRYWFRSPILVDKNNIIIAWHGRREASKKLQLTEVPVIIHTDLTEEQVKELRAVDNLVWDLADYNKQNLMVDFAESQNTWLVDIIKSQVAWFKLRDDDQKEMMEDLVPVVRKAKVIKQWDVIKLGNHRIMCWDSTLAKDVATLMNWVKADAVRTDPPYNVAYKWHADNTKEWIMNDNMSKSAFKEFLSDAFRAMHDHIKAGAGIYVFHNHKEQVNFQEALEEQGYIIKQQIIRNKPSLWLGAGDYRPKHELCFYCWIAWQKQNFYWDRTNSTVRDPLKAKTDEEIMQMIKKAREAEAKGQTTVWSVSRDNVNTYDHPTQKPVFLAQLAIQNSTKADDIVLDLFHGSGTCLITCEKTWRIAYAMELDPIYAETAIERRCQYTGEQMVDINGTLDMRDNFKNLSS